MSRQRVRSLVRRGEAVERRRRARAGVSASEATKSGEQQRRRRGRRGARLHYAGLHTARRCDSHRGAMRSPCSPRSPRRRLAIRSAHPGRCTRSAPPSSSTKAGSLTAVATDTLRHYRAADGAILFGLATHDLPSLRGHADLFATVLDGAFLGWGVTILIGQTGALKSEAAAGSMRWPARRSAATSTSAAKP